MNNGFFESSELIAHTRTWVTINLTNLKYNLTQIKNTLPSNTKIMAVVKADAYGHGDIRVAKVMLENQIDFLAVSNIDEALSLRRSDILQQYHFKILILGYTPPELVHLLHENDIEQTIISYEYAKLINKTCLDKNITLNTHIKIDTGMSRLGFDIDNFNEILQTYSFKNLQLNGIFTHLSSADSLEQKSVDYTKMQQDKFDNLIEKLSNFNIDIGLTHLQNSAGIITTNGNYNYARVGLCLYGLSPLSTNELNLKPAMSLKSVVAMVKEIDENTAISYGMNYITQKNMKIATIPIGYADGYPRALSNTGKVLINGEFADILGRVCMDQIMVDVTDINVKTGDIVTLVGQDGKNCITFDDIAKLIKTISYELVCLIGKRVPRESETEHLS